ncbi:hypothetical protein FHS95_002802 [Sphingomonas naasensis]|uniref:Uncharacterized protein n=1 Tax=Sphingomonas naasensis TaxID=1344951 RepID=A0A4S1W621_9SPHN|nr:hypothetical protein [Sphingomonas naasensis]NIJ21099.1 hypothetical protein [Sphingomonas naasensis]TGX38311.1 hypothetical protein E5A74_19105 [Sphingomonas naasensis]
MYDNESLKELARAKTRDAFRNMPTFLSLDVNEQKDLFREAYRRNYDELAAAGRPQQQSVSRALAEKASDMIDDGRHQNKRIEQAGELAGDFVDEVDFPGFVKDLLKGVFDANLKVTLDQMTTYQKLLQTATQSISKFANAIDDTTAFGYLAENQGDDFSIDFSDNEKEADGSPKAVLTNASGEPVDIGDNQVKVKIMEAKIAMAREQRALLRETILMGISRLVVEKGNVKAAVVFDIKATEAIDKTDKAGLKEAISTSTSVGASGGLIGSIFGGPRAGHTASTRKTRISVSSAKSRSTTDLSAKITGSVDITFKSDYFKLDNFATMYGPQAPAGAGAAVPAAPAQPAMPAR